MADDDETMPREAVELLAALMQSNADQVVWTYKQVLVGVVAERDVMRDMLVVALDSAEYGGTTRDYEAVLERCRAALYPPYALKDRYIDRAKLWVEGDPAGREPILTIDAGGPE